MSGPTCPCGGPLWCSPRFGLLGHHASSCLVGRVEDSQLHIDYELHRRGQDVVRDLTSAEETLLTAAGAELRAIHRSRCRATFWTPALRRRDFEGITVSGLPGMVVSDVPPGTAS